MSDLHIVPVDAPPTISEKAPIVIEPRGDEEIAVKTTIHPNPIEL